MSLNAATIEILIAKGLTAEDLLEVARATEVKADRTNAERQARHRRKRNAVTVTDAPPIEDHTPHSDPNGSGGSPPADELKGLFDRGVVVLVAGGRTEREARSLVGKWNKAHGSARTLEALNAAAGKPDPVAYASAILAKPASDLDGLMASVERKYPARAPPDDNKTALTH